MIFLFVVPNDWVLRSVGSVGTFQASDPWYENEPTTFSLEELRLVQQQSIFRKRKQPRLQPRWIAEKPRYAIKSEIDGQTRLLPEFLQELWQRKQIAAESLPLIYHRYQPLLKASDYKIYLRQTRRIGAIVTSIFGSLSLLLFLLYCFDTPKVQLIHPFPHKVSMDEWLEKPPRALQGIVAADAKPFDVISRSEWEVHPKVPPNVQVWYPLGKGYRLAWVKTGHGGRLLMMSDVAAPELDSGHLSFLSGTSFPPQQIGIEPADIKPILDQKLTLDSELIFCYGWSLEYVDYQRTYSLEPAISFFGLAIIWTLIMWIVFYPKRRRCKKLMKEALEFQRSVER